MKVVILYHPNSEHERTVLDYVRDYRMFKGQDKNIELRSLETVEGAKTAKLYDVVRYPAVLALADDGHMLKLWQEELMPLMNELDSYSGQ